MFQIAQITSVANQTQALVLPDGTTIQIQMYFSDTQLGWFFPLIQYQDFVLHGLRITAGATMLYQFKNQIPFGLLCTTSDGQDPTQIQSFSSGNARLFVLSQEEVEEYQTLLETKS